MQDKSKFRFRNVYMLGGSILVLLITLITDPDSEIIQNLGFGSGAIASIVILVKSILYVAMLHFSRRALFDYFDFEECIKQGMRTSDGAGRIAIAISIAMLAIAIVIFAATN